MNNDDGCQGKEDSDQQDDEKLTRQSDSVSSLGSNQTSQIKIVEKPELKFQASAETLISYIDEHYEPNENGRLACTKRRRRSLIIRNLQPKVLIGLTIAATLLALFWLIKS